MKQLQSPPLPHFCSNTDLDGWPRSGAGVLRAAGEAQGPVCGPLGGWLCWGRAARGWCPRGLGSCRRGPRLGHRGCSAGPRAPGHTHSRAGSGPRPPAPLQCGPRCTAARRPLSGRREKGSWAWLLVAEAWSAVSPAHAHHPMEKGSVLGLPSSPPPLPAPLCPQTTGTEDRALTCPTPF